MSEPSKLQTALDAIIQGRKWYVWKPKLKSKRKRTMNGLSLNFNHLFRDSEGGKAKCLWCGQKDPIIECPVTDEMRAEFARYASENGRTWRDKLNIEWSTSSAFNYGALLRFRNSIGPSKLKHIHGDAIAWENAKSLRAASPSPSHPVSLPLTLDQRCQWLEALAVFVAIAGEPESGSPIRLDEKPACLRLASLGLLEAEPGTDFTFRRTAAGNRFLDAMTETFAVSATNWTAARVPPATTRAIHV
jgi:hypothetical protein